MSMAPKAYRQSTRGQDNLSMRGRGCPLRSRPYLYLRETGYGHHDVAIKPIGKTAICKKYLGSLSNLFDMSRLISRKINNGIFFKALLAQLVHYGTDSPVKLENIISVRAMGRLFSRLKTSRNSKNLRTKSAIR